MGAFEQKVVWTDGLEWMDTPNTVMTVAVVVVVLEHLWC